jgi:hypothetical protein
MITNEDIKRLCKYVNDEQVETKEIETLAKKLKLIVRQIEVQENFNDEMSKISEEFEEIKGVK